MQLKKNIAISESGFLFNPSTGDSYSVNFMAHEILEMLRQNKSKNEIRQALTERYDVQLQQVEQDLDDFIRQLKTNNLLSN